MNLTTPRWWYRQDRREAVLLRLLLTPVSWAWAGVTARRIARSQPAEVGAVVICVGNLTVGGTGKTPVVRAVAKRLTAQGRAVHLLSRGYGGSERGPLQVDPARHSAAQVGDEPLMLAGAFPTWIAADRAAGARAAVAAGAEVIVMDDGHQNPSLAKSLSLIVVDGETRGGEWPFGDGAVFPAGPMREPLAAGLARADAAVVLLPADMPTVEPDLVRTLSAVPQLKAHLSAIGAPPPGPQVGFAGVGKPWKVERALQAAGCDLKDFAPFPDHQAYDERTLQQLAARAAQFGAGLVTTEKDWIRLPPEWRPRIASWQVEARFDDEAALDRLLASAFA